MNLIRGAGASATPIGRRGGPDGPKDPKGPKGPDQPDDGTARSRLLAALREPLHRTGNALVVNSALTAMIGVLFWAAAARQYSRREIGLNSTAITAMMMLAGFAQLNLMSAMVRFLPTSGRGALRLIRGAYLISAGMAISIATGYLVAVHLWAPQIGRLLLSWPMAPWFVVATALWCVFVLQDSVLTGLGRPMWVPVENTVHSVTKLGLVILLATVWPRHGVFMAWTLAVLAASIPVNIYLFARMIPRHVREAGPDDAPPPIRDLARFVLGDYAGSACWIATTAIPAQLVLSEEGASGAASFSIAWIVAFTMFAIPTAVGQGLVVQGSRNPALLDSYRAKAFKHTFLVLVPPVLVLVLAAPIILRLFGDRYALEGATDLRLVALSSLPYAVVSLSVSELRVRRRVLAVFCVLAAGAVLVLSLSYGLLEVMGINGVGLGWLIGESILAAAVLAGRRRLMGDHPPAADPGAAASVWPDAATATTP
jgi:O-antigen/teichoic acid export membrane protein